MTRIALATYADAPALTPDDRLLIAPLERDGIKAAAAVWDAPNVSWSDFDAVIVRSCWDYHHKQQAFVDWIDRLELTGVALWNPPSVLRWNMNKTYLRQLRDLGIDIAPTVWLPAQSHTGLQTLLRERGWEDAVVKPVVSGSAFSTWRTSSAKADGDQPLLVSMLQRSGVMVQRFVPEIRSRGKWSLLFFDGGFSHAVLKRPSQSDYRVQREFGGSVSAAPAPASLVAWGERILDAAPGEWLYARVDVVEAEQRPILMELEMLEPELFLRYDPLAPVRFAKAIACGLGQGAGRDDCP